MMGRTNQSGSRRREDEMMRRMLFGGNGTRHSGGMPVVPAMESVSDTAGDRDEDRCDLGNGVGGACSLAMVYSPKQGWQDLFSPEEALRKGTLFRELAKPFSGRTISGR